MKTWQIKKVSECIEKLPKKFSAVPRNKYQKEGKFPVVDQGQSFIGGYTDDVSIVYDDLPVIVFGDHTRAIKFIDFPFAVGADGTQVLKPKDFLDARYFYLALMNLDIQSRGYARHFSVLKNLEIPLPSLEEQKKIVKMLDEKMGKIAEVKRLREEALVDTEKILTQTLHEIFEEGKKNGWEEETIDSISKVGTGATPLKSNRKYYGGDIPWVTSKATSNPFVIKANDFITRLSLKETNCKINPVHTLLVAMYGEGKTRGQVSELLIEATTNQAIATVLVDEDKINRTFVKYFFVYNYKTMRQMAEGGPQLNLNLSKIKKMKISFPSLTEQQKIVARLDTLSEKIHTLRELQTTQLADLKSLERAYLREAFRG